MRIATLAMVCVAFVGMNETASAGTVPSDLVGAWTGSASNTHVTPSNAPMPLALTISDDGSVAGHLGEAKLRNGTIRKNRGWLGRLFRMKSDYLIYADLEGSLVAHKVIRYQGVFININVEGDRIVAAGFSTTHSPHGTPITKQRLVRGRIKLEKKAPSKGTKD